LDLTQWLTASRNEGTIIWLFNIGAEKYWHAVHEGIKDRNEDRLVNRMEEMNLLVCREQDILILREHPDPYFLDKLKDWGFDIPSILVPESVDPYTPISELVLNDTKLQLKLADIASNQNDVYFVPYAVTKLEEQIAEICGLQLLASPSEINATVNDKIFNRKISEELSLEVCKGRVCNSIQEIGQVYEQLVNSAPFFEKVIIKEPYGASGKGLYIIENELKLSPLLARLARMSKNNTNAQWLVEGWYRTQADLNIQIYISPSGETRVFSMKKQILKDTVYIGSQMPAELSQDVMDSYVELGMRIGVYLYEIGYRGIAGIDSIITEDGTIIPIIEINGRFTLSTYISFLGSVVGSKKVFSRYLKIVSDATYSFKDICSVLEREQLLYRKESGEGVLIYTSGTLPTKYDEAKGGYTGRLFALMVAENWDAVERYNTDLETCMETLLTTV
jgi:phosphoribosylaminoimidazole carboxylase (NCAIR synthetase)